MAENNKRRQPKKDEESGWKFWLQTIALTIAIYAVFFLGFKFILSNDRVSGPSMQPTFENGDKVIATRHSKLSRGDVIVLKAPDEANTFYIKRIIGLPGDTVVSKNNKIYINGKLYKEDFLDAGKKVKEPDTSLYAGKPYSYTYNFTLSSLAKNSPEWQQRYSSSYLNKIKKTNKVPAGTYFVMGDHRTVSKDSRIIGFINKKSVIGEVKWRYWPLTRWTVF
ncbi:MULTISPECIES: signal peptidase I [Companilactobacillus]|jgi:signal peptidase I|uniref:Signal peptidase I n=1 Tax=Companilactobacillus pabuli TaxID=2714036 RepID=A0A7L7KX85_9LACO|nr:MULTISPECIES: signal peptidase I [Companilactobacillus]AKP03875.1 signal peptidase [Companilactobacillus farciminis]AKS52180.1 signal peptidase [Companilactobacillus farciminis]MDG5113109.1 signal peptidase I [Companilactobacillus pabuli]QMT84069.1 signal peptidase I [Companilactobacillus pabuli]GAQ01998.1 signal peptidase [Companilactobacillus farciminis]